MKRRACLTILMISIVVGVLAQQTPIAVPDQVTAVQLAEKALTKIYGEKKIASERPFKAILHDGIWHVGGTLYCKDEHDNMITGRCVGGVAMALIRPSDGRVLKTGHTK